MRRLAAVLLGVVLSGSFGAPARAGAAPAVRMDLAPRTTVPAGWSIGARHVEPRLSAGSARTLTGVTMTYELDAGLGGVHLGEDIGSGCVARDERTTVCTTDGPLAVTAEPTVLLPVSVRA